MRWLPNTSMLPANVFLVLSLQPGHTGIRKSCGNVQMVQIPDFTPENRLEFVTRLLALHHKSLSAAQLETLFAANYDVGAT